MKFKIFVFIFFSIVIYSCGQDRYYLTGTEKELNPYKKDQMLVFESNKGLTDTLKISDIQSLFPDGLGVIDYNERIRVLADWTNEKNDKINYALLRIVAKSSKEDSYLNFEIRVGNKIYYSQNYTIDSLLKKETSQLKMAFGDVNDVIVLTNKKRYHKNTPDQMDKIYWSLSKGLVRFDLLNGDFWELVKIEGD